MDFQIRLIPDDYHLRHLGRTADGNLFWIDIQLRPEGDSTRDFVAVYRFNRSGELVSSKIIDLGLRSNADRIDPRSIVDRELGELAPIVRTEISVSPFSVEAYGSIFGLVVRSSDTDAVDDSEEEEPLVDALPGWTMLFYPPWEAGQYDT